MFLQQLNMKATLSILRPSKLNLAPKGNLLHVFLYEDQVTIKATIYVFPWVVYTRGNLYERICIKIINMLGMFSSSLCI